MTTPRNIRKQAEEAERLHGELFGTDKQPLVLDVKEPETPEEPEPEAPPEFTPGKQPPAQTAPVQPDQPPPSAKPEDTLEFWKNKYQTLEGKYRAEVPRAAGDIRDLKAQVNSLQQTLAAMNTQAPAAAASEKGLVSPEELEEYGEDFVSVMRRVAQEEVGRAVQKVVPKIEQVEGRLNQDHAQTQRERVYVKLDSDVEDWRTINQSRAFLDWLAEEDPYAGAPRSAMLTNAFERGDGSRVASFFKGFLAEQAVVTPKPSGNGADPQTPPARVQPQLSLEQLAGPRAQGGSGAPAPSSGDSPQPWTRRQIAAFYKDAQLGVYKTDPERYKQIQASIERAVQAGLVTP